jgi:hypothetical protein
VGEVFGGNGPFFNREQLRRFNVLGKVSYLPTSSTELTLQVQSSEK